MKYLITCFNNSQNQFQENKIISIFIEMQIPRIIRDLCQPAYVYFVISLVSFLLYLYIITIYSPEVSIDDYTRMGLLTNLIITIFWIYLLNQLCKIPKTGKKLAWFFVLLPFLVYAFTVIGYTCTHPIIKEEESKQNNSRIQVQS
jgi:hypothetical protein